MIKTTIGIINMGFPNSFVLFGTLEILLDVYVRIWKLLGLDLCPSVRIACTGRVFCISLARET